MAYQKLQFQITSESPILLHNGQTCDPTNSFAKQMKKINAKRGKTDADFEAIVKLEWYASLYTESGKIIIPSEVLESAFLSGGKKNKLGQKVQAGMFVEENAVLRFEGDDLPIDKLWERDQNRLTVGVRIQRAKVMRTRFKAPNWSAIVKVVFDDSLLNKSEVIETVSITGSQVGLCDWRPKFGRFVANEVA